MHAFKWETRQFVVEATRTLPLLRFMTQGAALSLGRSVNIVCFVAVATAFAFLIVQFARMTLQAAQLFVSVRQCPATYFLVVEGFHLPAHGAVAIGAVLAMASTVGVLRRMTIIAGGLWFQLDSGIVMAGRASSLCMGAGQGKVCICIVIKLCV